MKIIFDENERYSFIFDSQMRVFNKDYDWNVLFVECAFKHLKERMKINSYLTLTDVTTLFCETLENPQLEYFTWHILNTEDDKELKYRMMQLKSGGILITFWAGKKEVKDEETKNVLAD